MLVPLSPDGHLARWHGAGEEAVALRWENEGWTVDGVVSGADVQYAIRLSATWEVQQLLLFRDLPDPDLWLANDGHGRWGEVNGAHRPDLDGCTELWLVHSPDPNGPAELLTPFPATIPIRRLSAVRAVNGPGEAAQVQTAVVDVETLSVTSHRQQYEWTDDHHWLVRHLDGNRHELEAEFDADEHGLPLDVGDRFRRSA